MPKLLKTAAVANKKSTALKNDVLLAKNEAVGSTCGAGICERAGDEGGTAG